MTLLKKRWGLVFVIGGFFVACILSVSANHGLCLSQFRLVSDREYFAQAVGAVVTDSNLIRGTKKGRDGRLYVAERLGSVEKFLQDYPDCCTFASSNSGDGGAELSVLDQLTGFHTVRIRYRINYFDTEMPNEAPIVGEGSGPVAVSACGIARPIR